ncbi:MAG: hypothetical protein IAA89_05780 [Firmicutes bacterium]|uniref:dUTPase n=1 Tax=Candidatus Gallilactobacillus intestinavium TaxID=2840838 RepID=A0A9D9E668_9LACO|nr:hypothetical protein [Candidatus Gallilactobacillus intestinavium]
MLDLQFVLKKTSNYILSGHNNLELNSLYLKLDKDLSLLVDDCLKDNSELQTIYVKCMFDFMLIACKQKWQHLVIVETPDLNNNFSSVARIFLTLKEFILNSLFKHRQQDFLHAWRLFLAIGINKYQLNQDELQKSFEKFVSKLT